MISQLEEDISGYRATFITAHSDLTVTKTADYKALVKFEVLGGNPGSKFTLEFKNVGFKTHFFITVQICAVQQHRGH